MTSQMAHFISVLFCLESTAKVSLPKMTEMKS